MSLYANLLDTDGSASISRGPVRFDGSKDGSQAKRAIDPGVFLCQPLHSTSYTL